MQTVFVYGTLRAGEVNDISEAAARNEIAAPNLLGTATVRGHLFDFGSYPGLVVDEAGVDGGGGEAPPGSIPLRDGAGVQADAERDSQEEWYQDRVHVDASGSAQTSHTPASAAIATRPMGSSGRSSRTASAVVCATPATRVRARQIRR